MKKCVLLFAMSLLACGAHGSGLLGATSTASHKYEQRVSIGDLRCGLLNTDATLNPTSAAVIADGLNGSIEGILEANDPLEMREALDGIEVAVKLLTGDKSKEAIEKLAALNDAEGILRDALIAEIEVRAEEAHQTALTQTSLKDAMKEWQVGNFYLGLLPEAKVAEDAAKYQEYLTTHEQIQEKIKAKARLRYSIWAVGQIKFYTDSVQVAIDAWPDDISKLLTDGAKYMGPIDTALLTVEAVSLYNSIIQEIFGELNKQDKALLISTIEAVSKEGLK